ncbi:MAG: S8 family serine peptidase [Burkholderiales bacterium]|nr:S8 family serine peptidase [Burkholderiales bacterium]
MTPRSIVALLAAAFVISATFAQPKIRVEKATDIPRFTYKLDGNLEDVVRTDARFAAFTREHRANVESVLAKYEIADKASLRGLLSTLVAMDYLEGNTDAALKNAAMVRELEEKPADKLLSGLFLRTAIEAQKQVGNANSDAYRAALAKRLRDALEALPFDVVQNEVRELKMRAELNSESMALGYVRDVLQPTKEKAGSLSSDLAPALIGARYRLQVTLPLKQTLVDTYTAYLAKHTVAKKDIWAARDVALAANAAYKPVTVAVWDSGSDTSLFQKQVVRGADGKALVIAFDKYSRPSKGDLHPIPAALKSRLPVMQSRTKGFSDLKSNIDSKEATEVKQYLSSLKQAEYKAAIEEIQLAGNYMHGTHVAGITLAGNPFARLVTARIEFGHTLVPDPCPSREQAKRDADAMFAYVNFFRKHKVRVVNMSWGGDAKSIEGELELCGVGKTPADREKLARELFDISRSSMTKAFASAPEILFVTAAGNENGDSTFNEAIPAAIVLPNLLTVGAVDLAGDEASFTSYGPTVKVHANGYQVESYLPGGARVAESGTSMASPQIAGLAAKILAVNPKLKPTQVVDIIVTTADKTADGRRTLANPKKAVAAAIGAIKR